MKQLKASPEKRTSAFCLDTFVAFAPILIIFPLTFLGTDIQLILSLVCIVIGYLFFPIIFKGKTLGKKMSNLKVVLLNGEDASIGRIFLRETIKSFLSVISVMMYPLFCGIISVLRKKVFAPHDLICGTQVIDLSSSQKYNDIKNDKYLKSDVVVNEEDVFSNSSLFDELKKDTKLDD